LEVLGFELRANVLARRVLLLLEPLCQLPFSTSELKCYQERKTIELVLVSGLLCLLTALKCINPLEQKGTCLCPEFAAVPSFLHSCPYEAHTHSRRF
jgi:hypothetical protein